jgi:diguanylate cyclase (GGDEF)-like protein
MPLAREVAAAAPAPPLVAGLHPILAVLKEMNSERNLRRLVSMILDTTIRFSNASRGSIALFKGDRFNAELARDRNGNEIDHADIAALGSVLKIVSDEGRSLIIHDARRDPRVQSKILLPGHDPASILCLPLSVRSRMIGAVYLDNTQTTHAFGPGQREYAEILTDHAAIAIENALLQRQTTCDRTTQVSNHAHFEQMLESELERAQRLHQPVALLMIDVDNFKQINDTHGHEPGSEVLREIAWLLSSTVRGEDIVARSDTRAHEPLVGRYGGDEFEILLPGADREGALKTAQRLVATVREAKFQAGKDRINVSISIGIAAYPTDAEDPSELMIRADEALYRCKRSGKGRAVLSPLRKRPPGESTTVMPKV